LFILASAESWLYLPRRFLMNSYFCGEDGSCFDTLSMNGKSSTASILNPFALS
jgi:hypothetical protein